MDNLFEDNQAGKRLLVGELEVIGEISGKGIKEIKTSINAIQAQNKSFQAQQQNYWKDLASDSVITPSEKKTLYKEFLSIQQSYAAIDKQATAQGLQSESYVRYYKEAYGGLYEYLYETLRVFDDMQINTPVNSSELNTFYSNYYFWQNYATIGLTTGIIGNFDLKALHSLDEPGEEGQIGVYKGQIYQYTNGAWKPVGLEGYIGARDSVPAASLNQYFIASDDFIGYDNLFINDEQLLINDEELIIGLMYEKGFIYAYEQSGWIKVADKTDYRYVVAMTDLVQTTGELPGVYQQAIDTAVDAIKKEYKGPLLNPPSNPHNGDYFVYTGIEHDDWHNSCIYKYDSVNRRWDFMDPTESLNGPLYQSCLDDILKQKNLENGYFAAIFASSFFAHAATMDQLSVQEIRIKNDGCIVSEGDAEHSGWIARRQGLRIDSTGNIDANGDTHIGGHCDIDGRCDIGDILVVNAKTGSKIQGDILISGALDCGQLKVENREVNFYRQSTDLWDLYDVIGNILEIPETGNYDPEEYYPVDYKTKEKYSFTSFSVVFTNGDKTYYVTPSNISISIVRGSRYIKFNNGEYVMDGYTSNITGTLRLKAKNKLCMALNNIPALKPTEEGLIYKNTAGQLFIS